MRPSSPYPLSNMRSVRRPSICEQLAGLQHDLAVASGETRDPLAAAELVSAARRVRVILQRVEASQ